MSILSPFARFILSWVILVLIITFSVFQVVRAYQKYGEAEKFYKQVEALSYGGIFDPFEVDRERRIVSQQYDMLLFYLLYNSFEAGVVLLIAGIKLTSFNRFKWKYAKQLERHRAKRLYECVEELASDIGLRDTQFTLWFDNASYIAPSCTTRRGHIHFICPSGFINLFTLDPPVAKAMLAHELGHVVQEDANLWRVLGAARYCIAFLLTMKALIIGFYILFGIYSFFGPRNPSRPSFWFSSVVFYIIYITIHAAAIEFISNSKKKSEMGADILAAYVVTPVFVLDAIKKYLSNNADDSIFTSHPTKKERVRNIEAHFEGIKLSA